MSRWADNRWPYVPLCVLQSRLGQLERELEAAAAAELDWNRAAHFRGIVEPTELEGFYELPRSLREYYIALALEVRKQQAKEYLQVMAANAKSEADHVALVILEAKEIGREL